jgi:ABC-2 type transport system permease protein
VDLDGSRLSQALLDSLKASAVVRLVEHKPSAAERLDKKVRDADLAAAMIIPEGYGDSLLTGDPVRFTVIQANDPAGQTALSEIQAAGARLAGAAQAARLSMQAVDDQARLLPGDVQTLPDEPARQQFLSNAVDQALAAWENPPLTLEVRQSGTDAEPTSTPTQNGFLHMSPSMMVQFAIAGLIGSASLLVVERKSGALRRLLTTRIARTEIILGHYLAMAALILAQLAILVVFGQLALQVPFFRHPAATLVTILATALWTAALGLLIGTVAKTQEQAVLFSIIPMFVLAGVGGAWMPLEYAGKTFQAIGHLLPTAWAMDALENITIRGVGLESVLLPSAVMLAYAVGLFGLAAWRFRFE